MNAITSQSGFWTNMKAGDFARKSKKVMGSWQYDDSDLERLSMIMTLHDVGFTRSEIETYMHLPQEGDHTKELRMQMLTQKRDHALDEIHFKEAQLARLDYLRHSINTKKKI